MRLDGTRHMKLYLDPLDREKMQDKTQAMAAIYKKLTTKDISIDFAKPTSFQKKLMDALHKQ